MDRQRETIFTSNIHRKYFMQAFICTIQPPFRQLRTPNGCQCLNCVLDSAAGIVGIEECEFEFLPSQCYTVNSLSILICIIWRKTSSERTDFSHHIIRVRGLRLGRVGQTSFSGNSSPPPSLRKKIAIIKK